MWRWRSAALTLIGVLVSAAVGACLLPTPPAAAVAPRAHGPVIVVGVPDLRWQDLDAATTPVLWNLLDRSAVAAMTDRSGTGTARRATGWLTLNTGSRARANVPADAVPDVRLPAEVQALRRANDNARYRADVGALGDALHRAGLTVAAVGGPGAAIGAMAGNGSVDARPESVAAALHPPAPADVVVVELPQLYGVDRADVAVFHDAVAAVDSRVHDIVAAAPADATVLVVGVSDAETGPGHLHVAMAAGPAYPSGWLTSASTGRDRVVQLIDVAPTVLWLEGVAVPSEMLGQHWVGISAPDVTAEQRASSLARLDDRSRAVIAASTWYNPFVLYLAVAFAIATLLAWRTRRTSLVLPAGAFVAAIPAASWLAQTVPWWRAGTWPLAPLIVAFAAVISLPALLLPWIRHDHWRVAGYVGGVSAAVIVADAAAGSPLSLDAPFGDNPIIAGRFHGIGNIAFAVLGTGTLLLAAAVAAHLKARPAAVAVLGIGAVAVLVDGHPALGDDFGGVLGLLPAVAVLALAVSGVRMSVRHALAILAATLATATAFALFDFSRPPAERTHLGRFVGQVVDGTAGPVVHRKLNSSLATFTGGWPRWIVLTWVLLLLAAYVGGRRGWLRRSAIGRAQAGTGLVLALVVLSLLGAALNDSGLAIAAFAGYVAVPLLVPLVRPVGRKPA